MRARLLAIALLATLAATSRGARAQGSDPATEAFKQGLALDDAGKLSAARAA